MYVSCGSHVNVLSHNSKEVVYSLSHHGNKVTSILINPANKMQVKDHQSYFHKMTQGCVHTLLHRCTLPHWMDSWHSGTPLTEHYSRWAWSNVHRWYLINPHHPSYQVIDFGVPIYKFAIRPKLRDPSVFFLIREKGAVVVCVHLSLGSARCMLTD